jgi:hypothetical protein
VLITYLRSSSYGSYDFCQNQYFMQYPLGIKQPSTKKMTLGSIVHKALEMLAKQKLAMQQNKTEFLEDETQLTIPVDMPVSGLVEAAYKFYSEKESHLDWGKNDNDQCHNWTNDTLLMNNGLWNPMGREIVAPELYFDITFEEEWAKYDYKLPDGSLLSGHLSIKGTSDLLVRVNDDTLEIIDWKTGRRWDWGSDKVKDYEKLRNDPQLRIYFLAICHLFPEIKHVIVSIVFIQDGDVVKATKGAKGIPNRGAFSLPYERSVDIPLTLKMLERRFKEVKENIRPKLSKSWKCKAFCHFGRTKWKDSEMTICEFFEKETRKLGMAATVEKHANIAAISNYGDGGGSSTRDQKKEESNGQATISNTAG